jgi:putative membrane protein
MWWNWGNWWGMGLMTLFMVLFWGGVIALIIWLIARSRRNQVSGEKSGPIEIAKERYAKGEITREQFEQLKKDLS